MAHQVIAAGLRSHWSSKALMAVLAKSFTLHLHVRPSYSMCRHLASCIDIIGELCRNADYLDPLWNFRIRICFLTWSTDDFMHDKIWEAWLYEFPISFIKIVSSYVSAPCIRPLSSSGPLYLGGFLHVLGKEESKHLFLQYPYIFYIPYCISEPTMINSL